MKKSNLAKSYIYNTITLIVLVILLSSTVLCWYLVRQYHERNLKVLIQNDATTSVEIVKKFIHDKVAEAEKITHLFRLNFAEQTKWATLLTPYINQEISYISFVDLDNKRVWQEPEELNINTINYQSDVGEPPQKPKLTLSVMASDLNKSGFMEFVAPINVDDKAKGVLQVGISLKELMNNLVNIYLKQDYNILLTLKGGLDFSGSYFLSKQDLNILDTQMQLLVWPKPIFFVKHHSPLEEIVLWSGAGVTLLFMFLLFLLEKLRLQTSQISTINKNITHRARQIDLLYKISSIFLDRLNIDDYLRKCLVMIREEVGCDLAHVVVIDVETNTLKSEKLWDVEPGVDVSEFKKITEESTFISGEDLPGKVWASANVVWMSDLSAQKSQRLQMAAKELNMRTAFAFPIISNKKLIAILEFFSTKNIAKDSSLMNTLQILGAQIAKASEQYDTEIKLRNAELYQRSVLNSAGEGILGLDLGGHLTFMNQSAERMLGYKEYELKGKNCHSIIHYNYPDGRDYPKEDCKMQAVLNTGRDVHVRDEVLWRKDGSNFPVEYTSSAIVTDEKTLGSVVIFSDITEKLQAEEVLHHMAHNDHLTGVLNRASLEKIIAEQIAYAKRKNSKFAVLYVDLDNFKGVNDTLGHAIGDKLLIEVAKRIQQQLREYDIIARLGGDEFVVVVKDCDDEELLKTIANKILKLLNAHYDFIPKDVKFGASIGIAIYPDDAESYDALLYNADKSLYEVKKTGKGGVVFYKDL